MKVYVEEGFWMECVFVFESGLDQVLIKVCKLVICGIDVYIWKWDEWLVRIVFVLMVVGYEFCGEIVDCGKVVLKFCIG